MVSSDSELRNVAQVSDQIRQLYLRSFHMRLHATNAMVATRARGVSVPGFEVVSHQMGELSQELNTCLSALRAATARWVRVVSGQLAYDREHAMLSAAAAASPMCARRVAPVIAQIARDELALEQTKRELIAVLDEARQLAAAGCVLARTAKLEAVYAPRGMLADALCEAAATFTELADSVDGSVRVIARRIGDGTRRLT